MRLLGLFLSLAVFSANAFNARTPLHRGVSLPAVSLPALRGKHAVRMQDELEPADPSFAKDSCPTEEESSFELLKFILPTLAGWLSSEVMSVVDTAIVGSCSSAELAALGPATMLTDSSAYMFFWLNVATTSLFATALAKGKTEEAYDTLSDGLWISLACGIFLTTVLGIWGPAVLGFLCAGAPEIVPAAATYLKIRVWGLPAFMSGMVLQAACLGAKDPISPLLVLVTCGALNFVLDVFLVKTLAMGIGGAAIATLAAQLLQVLLPAIVVQRKRSKAMGSGKGWLLLQGRPEAKRLLRFLGFAGPIFFVLVGKICCYNAMTIAATTSGLR